MMDPFDRITFESNIMGGRACIRGMRITVATIMGLLSDGASAKEFLEDDPDLEPDDIKAALAYAAWLTREDVSPV